MNKQIKLTITHDNGNSIELMIDTMEYNAIMRILNFTSSHAPYYGNNIHRALSVPQKLEKENLHNGNISPPNGDKKS